MVYLFDMLFLYLLAYVLLYHISMKTTNHNTYPYSVKQENGTEYISDHKTRKAAEKAAKRQTNLWKGKRKYIVVTAH